jgi:hypothetical protein
MGRTSRKKEEIGRWYLQKINVINNKNTIVSNIMTNNLYSMSSKTYFEIIIRKMTK